MPGVDKNTVVLRLKEWGFWLRTARSPGQSHILSRFDTPLSKKRTIKPVYRCENAEILDLIMSFHLERMSIDVLDLYYAQPRLTNQSAAAIMGCCVRTYTSKRREAESILWGIFLAIQNIPKVA